MHRILQRHRWATLGVVGLLLFATSGLMLSRMTCLMSGRTVVTLGLPAEDCSEPGDHTGSALGATCCVFGQVAAQVEPFVPMAAMAQVAVPLVAITLPADAGSMPLLATHRPWDHERAPPLACRIRLALHATYRI